MSDGEDFSFIGAGTFPMFLKIRDGCYVRARDIVGICIGTMDEHGNAVHMDTVYVYTNSGFIAAFEPCASQQDAADRAQFLTAALCKAQATAVSQMLPDMGAN